MDRKEFMRSLARIHKQARRIMLDRNMLYGEDEDPTANLRECEEMGIPSWVGCIVRASDKWARIKAITSKILEDKPMDEPPEVDEPTVGGRMMDSLIDSLVDLMNYCALAIIQLGVVPKIGGSD